MSNLSFIFAIIGIPAFIYSWFIDITSDVDLWKNIIIGLIGIIGGSALAGTQVLKFIEKFRDLKKKK